MRILVVDDHEVVRKGICSVLETDPQLAICGEAVNGQDAVEKAVALRPDIVIMDIGVPGLNGLESRQRDQAPGSRSRNRDREPARGSPNGSPGISRRRPRLYLKIKRHHRPAPSHRAAHPRRAFPSGPGLG